jgi:hypothetical protein
MFMRNFYALVCAMLVVFHHDASAQSNPIRVLFFGNSFLAYRNVPGVVASFAAADGIQAEVKDNAVLNQTLERIWHIYPTSQLFTEKWDYVVLQEHGPVVMTSPSRFLETAGKFDAAAKKAGAKTVLLSVLTRSGPNQTQIALDEGISKAAAGLGALVAPAGEARLLALEANPGLNLWDNDGVHPNALGAYLMGCSIYLAISAKEICPEPEIGGVDKESAAKVRVAVQRAAAQLREKRTN